jgi:23S rRNA (cytosine1962-C5)-methyltransferase
VEQHIILRKNEEHRIEAGHQWVFSNEIASVHGAPTTGDLVEVRRHDGRFIGQGFYHVNSLIAVRMLTTDHAEIGTAFFEARISTAERLRRRLFPGSEAFRLVHGESDFLPGLVIDKYNEYLALQVFSAGMDRRVSDICDALESLYHPKAIVARNDFPMRALEHLPQETVVLRGTPEPTIVVDEDVKYSVDVQSGQKTGFFLDQRQNRRIVRRLSAGLDVLDCFCNEGGFALHAAAGRAKQVTGVDISEPALARARVNAGLNQFPNVAFAAGDVFEALKQYQARGTRFDMVILDPPSFTKSKKTVATALKGYRQINTLGFQIVRPGGFLVTASCSHHIGREEFLEAVRRSALKAARSIQLIEFAGASPDHPVLPSMPETEYLKFAVFSVL